MKAMVLAVTGASGAIYAKRFMERFPEAGIDLSVLFTETGKAVFRHETGISYEDFKQSISGKRTHIRFIPNSDFGFKYASGSNVLDCMVVLPCSMGSLARIAQGVSTDLIGRIADVQLKERRKLILVPRESPYSLIHLRNMTALTEAGAVIAPASPSFYAKPEQIHTLVDSFSERIMEIAGIAGLSPQYRW